MIDLRSDTVTKPTTAMRKAMAEAEVGDDVFGDDPTVNRLEARCAELSGKEAALFVPSGTMANQIAIRVHTRPGDEVLMESGAHPFNHEAGGAAVISGVQIRTVPGERGILSELDVVRALRPANVHFAPATLLCVEDTSNRGGGSVYPLERLMALAETARQHRLSTHLDGARAFNAVVASGISLGERYRSYDTISFCFSKGLGAPVGSVLCGPRDLLELGRRVRKMLGGGLRQAGILAAGAHFALDHHIDRLAEDHALAIEIAKGLRDRGFAVSPPETNMVYVPVQNASQTEQKLATAGVRCLAVAPDCLRLVTHLDVPTSALSTILQAFAHATPE